MPTNEEREEYSRRKRCDGKIRHRYRLCADHALQAFYDSGELLPKGYVMEVYLCNHCDGWHIGKRNTKKVKP